MANNKPGFSAKITNEKEFKQTISKDWPDFTRFAVANTASRVAFLGMERTEDQFRKDFDLKNNYLTGTGPGKGVVKFNRAIPHHDLDKISSSWGTPDKRGQTDLGFLEDQEEGFTQKKFTPSENARKSGSRHKRIRKNLIRSGIEVLSSRGFPGKSAEQRAIFFLRQAYLNRYAMPGSKQFIYIDKGEFHSFREGMYQFTSGTPELNGQFPKIQAMYYKKDKVGQKRKAVHWMETAKNTIKQNDIDKIYFDEFNKAFNRGVKRNW